MKILHGAPTGVDKIPRELPRKHLLHTLRASDSNTLLSATTIMSRLPHHVIRTESSQSSTFSECNGCHLRGRYVGQAALKYT